MKDKLSNLVQFNERSLACDSVEKAVSTWLPLLEAVSSLKGVSEVTLISSLLFNGLNNEWLYEHIEIDAETKQKSGTLDKLSDDCLTHCLSFLHYKDVVTNVEATCRRLLHVSRSMKRPFRVKNFNDCFQNRECRHFPFRLAPRFHALQIDVTQQSPFRYEPSWLIQDIVANFGDCLEQLTFDDSVTEITDLAFDKLKHIQCADVDSSTLVSFARRNPTVDSCVLSYKEEDVLTREFFTNLREMHNLRRLTLDITDWNELELDPVAHHFGAEVWLKQVSEVTLTRGTRLALVRPLLHSKLKRLSLVLNKAHNEDNVRTEPLALGALQQLTVCGERPIISGHSGHALERVLGKLRTDASVLRQLSVANVTLECLVPSLLLCPRGEVSVVVSDYITAERVAGRRLAFEMWRANAEMHTLGPTTLRVTFEKPFYDKATRFFLRVMLSLAQMLADTEVIVSFERHRSLEGLGKRFRRVLRTLRALPNVELIDRTEGSGRA